MGSQQIILCNACKTNPATTFIQGTFEIVGKEQYRVKCLNLALCEACAAQVDLVTDNGSHLAEALIGGAQ
jgi:hypothetical protein